MGHAVKEYPKEACGFLYTRNQYTPNEEWMVESLDNVSDTPETSWIPSTSQTRAINKKNTDKGWTKIGNIHSHPVKNVNQVKDQNGPSDLDLKYARKFNDVVRIIIVTGPECIFDFCVHDKFGNNLNIPLTEGD